MSVLSQAALNLTAVNICTLVLASILKVSENSLSAHEESLFMLQCRQFAMQCVPPVLLAHRAHTSLCSSSVFCLPSYADQILR